VCQCVQKCHEMNITHRDIKPENILFRTQKGIVLADFGICKFGTLDLGTEALEMEKRGTPFYMAPEQLRDYLPQSKPADIFALGRILHFDISEKIISRPIRTRVRKIASQCTRQNISSRPNIKKLITLIENAIKAAKSLRETKPIIRRLIKISSACNDRLNKQGNNIIEIEGLYIRQRMEEFNEIVGKNSHYRTTKNWYLEEVPRYYAPYFTNIKTGLSPDEKKKSILYETKRFLAHMRKYYSDLP